MKSITKLRTSKKQNKGITLIVLVITIIILLILAGVTIAALTGEKGLIKEAKTAAELTELASLEEQVELAIIKAEQKHRNPTLSDVIEELKNYKVITNDDQVTETGTIITDAGYEIKGKLDDYLGNISTGDGNTTGNNTTGGNTTGNNTGGGTTNPPEATLPSTDNTKPFLPEGATKVEGTNLDTGLVIKDSNGNEWVWVEVPKSIYNSTTTNTDYTAIETAMKNYASDYQTTYYVDAYSPNQGFADTTEYSNWKNSMLKSVFDNGGFYVGRYETGTKTPRFSASDSLTIPIIQKDAYPYNFVICSQAQELSEQLSIGENKTSLMFGIQWDLTLKFIEEKRGKTKEELTEDATSWGNYSTTTFVVNSGLYTTEPKISGSWNIANNYTKPYSTSVYFTTGATNRNSVLGIYDLAGNIFEWTLERQPAKDGDKCVTRDGYAGSTGSAKPPVSRSTSLGASLYLKSGFRTALW